MKLLGAQAILVVAACASSGPPRWQTLPTIPAIPAADATGDVVVGDARIHYATYGHGSPVVLLHGGLGNGDYWALQVPSLVANHQVILIDSRGQGRSTLGSGGVHYAQMANDVISILDRLKIDRASFVGWSDGANIGLELAIHHADRVTRVFAFAANADTSAIIASGGDAPVVKQYVARASADTTRLSGDPNRLAALGPALQAMTQHEPSYTDADLASIRVSVAIVDGDHDELIASTHTRALARRIPGAKLIILPASSHLAPWQAPDDFNRAMTAFVDH